MHAFTLLNVLVIFLQNCWNYQHANVMIIRIPSFCPVLIWGVNFFIWKTGFDPTRYTITDAVCRKLDKTHNISYIWYIDISNAHLNYYIVKSIFLIWKDLISVEKIHKKRYLFLAGFHLSQKTTGHNCIAVTFHIVHFPAQRACNYLSA